MLPVWAEIEDDMGAVSGKTDRHFNHANPSIGASIVRVNRRFLAAAG
jgi:hypothetical protein